MIFYKFKCLYKMSTYTKVLLSGSNYGLPIKVAATATTGTTIHATDTSSTVIDEVWLYANNTDSTDILLTIEFGGTTAPDNTIVVNIAARSGLFLVIPGFIITGTGAASKTITAFAGTANKVLITGYVNRIS